jgi:hypothetical protein
MAKKVYIAGPMRGRKLYNFPEFDRVGGILKSRGYEVFSPADLDRQHGFDPWELPKDHDWNTVPEGFDLKQAFFRDLGAVAECNFICLLDGWTDSVGARCEYFAARWLGLQFIVENDGMIFECGPGWEPASLIHASEIPQAVAREIDQGAVDIYFDGKFVGTANALEVVDNPAEKTPEEEKRILRQLTEKARKSMVESAGDLTPEQRETMERVAVYWDSNPESPEPPESILAEAQRITGGDRQAQYGPPDQDFSRTAGMWTSLFGELLRDGARFEARHVAMAMIVVKLSRLMYGAKRDSVVDIAGYAHCLSLCDDKPK